MIRTLVCLALLLWSGALAAQTFPAFYDVSGVDSGDVLNVRSAPSVEGDLVGVLAPNQSNLEVIALSDDGRWARVNIEEQSGWTSVRFLTLVKDYPFLPSAHLNCYGTEPFWSLDKPQTQPMTLSILGQEFAAWRMAGSHRSPNRIDRFSVIAGEDDDLAVLTLSRGMCSDGMSDRQFGIQADFIRPNADDNVHLSGCCSIQP